MDLDYFVLNVKQLESTPVMRTRGTRGTGIPSGGDVDVVGGTLGGVESPSLDKINLDSQKLNEAQARDAARDPDNVVAPVMPVTLIAPCLLSDFGMQSAGDPIAEATQAKVSWGIGCVGADATDLTGAGVKAAVLDTGIHKEHPAFAGVELICQNFAGGDTSDVSDRQGHGTHCAGTVFGRDVDGVRIGVARGVPTAIIGKVLDDRGRGSTAAVLKALKWAGEQGANVVSMSLGFDFPGMQEQLEQSGRPGRLATSMALKAYRENLNLFETLLAFLMLENAASPGMVVVAASGNESMRQLDPNFVIDTSLPAAASADIISVGAFGRTGDRFSMAPFSNVNPVLCAPGVDIVSAKAGGGLKADSGTSMACPHVAGLAALWWERLAKTGDRATGGNVSARVIASALTAGFADGVTFTDRGNGRPVAPPAGV